MKNKASIVILTKNAGNNFENTLKGIFSQSYKDFEVIVIDSDSSDNTLDIAREYPVKIIKIKQEEFGHGKTRNFGAKIARGSYIVFMTQDAVPNNENWLSELIKPLKDKKVVGVYSRQIPKGNENIVDKFFYLSLYPDCSKVWDADNFSQGDNIFSNVSSAIKKEILLKHFFNENIILSEDYEWAKNMLKQGYKIVYNAESEVTHSHSYTLKSVFKRNFDIGVSYKRIYESKSKKKGFLKKGLKIYKNEVAYLIENKKPLLIPYCTLKDMTKYVAINLGKRSQYLPNFINKKLSNYPRYWR